MHKKNAIDFVSPWLLFLFSEGGRGFISMNHEVFGDWCLFRFSSVFGLINVCTTHVENPFSNSGCIETFL